MNTTVNQSPTPRQVRDLILQSIDEKTITSQQAATKLNVPVRSLHRLLRKQGTSFKLLREQLVNELAEDALINTDLSIKAIASKLNYSETSPFDRMFKRMNGVSPTQYRRIRSTDSDAL